MSSFRTMLKEGTSKQIVNDKNNNLQKATYNITPKGTNMIVSRHLTILTDIDKQDLFEWRKEFIESVKVCNWSEEAASNVLSTIIHTKYLPLLEEGYNTADRLNAILRYKYPKSKALSYYAKLASIQQDDYYTIEQYMEDLDHVCKKLSVAKGWTDSKHKQQLEESFYNGLNYDTKLEMNRLGHSTCTEIINNIQSCEQMMIEQLRCELNKQKPYNATDSKYLKNKYHDNNKHNSKMYCKHHKVTTHRTEDCRASTRQENNKGNGKDNNKTYAIKEHCPKPENIELTININSKKIAALIDTGSAHNYMTEKTATTLQLDCKNLDIISKAELANGEVITISKECQARFFINNNTHIMYLDTFRILPTSNAEIILGMEFLIKNDAMISIKDNYITIDGKEYEMSARKTYDNFENQIHDKTRILAATGTECENADSKINDLIGKAKQENPIVGLIKESEHAIELKADVPHSKIIYQVPHRLIPETQDLLNQLLQHGIIRKSNARSFAPAFIIKKKNGKLRLVVDYRLLNKHTKPVEYPFPIIHEYLTQLQGNNVFSQIDLNMGYYQVPIRNSDIEKTAFALCNEVYEFQRMPFGLSNAPRTFQRCMNRILGDLKFVKIYIDDILIHSTTIEDHYQHLSQVLNRLSEAGASINFEKSVFVKPSVTYLGATISREGIKADISRVDTMLNFIPKNKRGLQRILGFINWFRPFLANLSIKLAPIYKKLENDRPFNWTDNDAKIVETIFDEIKAQTLLKYPNPTDDYTLCTDATEQAFGAILQQNKEVIGLYSGTFTQSEINYSIVEKETLAIVKALTHFKSIVFNAKIKIFSDNANLIYQNTLNKRINRWKLLLEEFDYELLHIDGKENFIADSLSRLTSIKPDTKIKSLQINISEIYEKQKKYLLNEIKTQKNLKEKKIEQNQILVDDQERIFIPKEYSLSFCKYMHVLLSHPCQQKSYYTLRSYFYVPEINNVLKKVTENCHTCQTCKNNNKKYGKLHGGIFATRCGEKISSDIMGPLKIRHFRSERQNDYFYLLTCTDVYSRFTIVVPIYDITASTVTQAIENQWIKIYGAPEKFLTDQGRQYTSSLFADLMKRYKIKHSTTSAYNPTGNSISERINSQIGDICRISKGSSIPEFIDKVNVRLNFTTNRTTKLPPYEIFFKKPIFALGNEMTIKMENVLINIEKAIENNNKLTNDKRKDFNFSVGQQVYKKLHSPDKAEDKWAGPYAIEKIEGPNVVWLNENNKITRHNIKNVRPVMKEGEDVAQRQ